MAKTKKEEININENKENETTPVTDTVNGNTSDMLQEIKKQLEEINKMKIDFLKEKENFEKEKSEFAKSKENTTTAGNEYIEVVCNIPKFAMDDLGAYEIYSRSSNRFIKMPKYSSKCTVQYCDLQDMMGTPDNGLIIGSILISKNDGKAIRDLGLEHIYKYIVYPEDMDEFLKKSIDETRDIIKNFPIRMKEAFIEVVRNKVNRGQMDSIGKLRDIESILNIKF